MKYKVWSFIWRTDTYNFVTGWSRWTKSVLTWTGQEMKGWGRLNFCWLRTHFSLFQSQFLLGIESMTSTINAAGTGAQATEWDEIDSLGNDKQKAAWKYCSHIISAKIEKVRAHIQKCPKRKAHYCKKENFLFLLKRGIPCSSVGAVISRMRDEKHEAFASCGNELSESSLWSN